MRILIFSIFSLLICLFVNCKKTAQSDCFGKCPLPTICIDGTCQCNAGRKLIGGFCLNPESGEYVAFLPEKDLLDTFMFQIGPGIYGMRHQDVPSGLFTFQGKYAQYAHADSFSVDFLPIPGSKGWDHDTLNGKRVFLKFSAALRKDNPDTLFSRIRWIGWGSGTDLREPLDFKMFLVK